MIKRAAMKKPPEKIDGALVLFWAWSGRHPFFLMPGTNGGNSIPIFGLAVCRYLDSGEVYRFSCSENWETENDTDYGSAELAVEEAMRMPSGQYDVSEVAWHRYQ